MFDHADNGTITPNEISFVLRAFGANPKEADIKEMKQLCIEDRGLSFSVFNFAAEETV